MTATYAVSDVHGYRPDLLTGLSEVGLVDGSGSWTGGEDQLWVLGDLCDRGPDGIGSIELAMSLQQQAPEQVHVVMGNHEALAVAMKRFPRRFRDLWAANGGRRRDQTGLTEEHLEWLASLPVMARLGDRLLVHSDTIDYLAWGESVDEINAEVRAALASDDPEEHFEVFARLTGRYDFAGSDGGEVVSEFLDRLGGGSMVVHGHTLIGLLRGMPSRRVKEPWVYADGKALAIDGGRYDGGPLLVVPLDSVRPGAAPR